MLRRWSSGRGGRREGVGARAMRWGLPPGAAHTWLNTSCSLLMAGMMLSPSEPLARKGSGMPRGAV